MVDARKAENIYQNISERLKKYRGKILAIETKSGDYFVGEDPIDACDKARAKHPDGELFLKRIGAKHTFIIGAL